MKVVFLLPSLNFSGGIKIVIQIANGLKRKGHDVSIYYPRFPLYIGRLNRNRLNGYIESEVPLNVYISNIQIPNADIIVATSWETAEILDTLWKKRKDFQPLYFIQHVETWDYYNTGEYSMNDYLALNTYTLPYPKIVTSSWEKQYINWDYYVPIGIDPVPKKEKSTICIENGCPYIMGLLRGIPWKGDDIILDLKKQYPVNTFMNLSNQYLDDVLWETNIFLSASLVEGFNLPVLEAMAHECCCITTNTGATPDYSDNGSGVCFVDRSVQSFADSINYLRENPDEIIKIGRIARKLSEEWTTEKMINEFEKVLKRVNHKR